MKYNPDIYHRRSIRVPGYDYTQSGWYFVTLCSQNREMIFGDIIEGKIALNTVGMIIDYHWRQLPQHFTNIELDEYQVMPNHFHGIIHIVRAMQSSQKKSKIQNSPAVSASPQRTRPHGTTLGSLGAILQNFQSVTTRKINKIKKTPGLRLWQRNYYERIIRDEPELDRIRKYIIDNPLKWQDDRYSTY